jgi:hypothetical protein
VGHLKGDFAEFEVQYSNLPIGVMTLRLDKTGIKVAKSENLQTDKDSYELPVGLVPGKTWTTKTTESSELNISATYKVVGTGDVKTAVASYKDALIVTATGKGKARGADLSTNMKMWLVKGRGAVKTEMSNIVGGKAQKSVLEEAK